MSNIFDINTLLSENTLADELLAKRFPSETYMFSAINSLNSFNESVLSMNKELYKSLNEATSKAQENAIFGEFYKKYNNVLDKYINEVNTMVGRFTVTLDNLVDANMSLANDQDVLGCDKQFTCPVKKYKNLCGGKYPKFNPLEIYQREFNYIGQMMQDLGPIATDVAKLEVLSTVSNQMCNKMKNKWLEKCIEDITGEDDCKDLTCYAKILNTLFVEEEDEIVVNKGTIYAIKEEITGYEKYKDAILSIANKLISDFTYISKNIGGMFFRNKDNVLPIRSEDDSTESRDYQLDTYGMNQLDIFMKSKVNQVSQLCSLYVIALSVMMDNIISYITQCKDILERVKDACCEPEFSTDSQNTSLPTDPSGEDNVKDDNGDGAPDELNIQDESPDNEEEPEEPKKDQEVPEDDDSMDISEPDDNFNLEFDEPENEQDEPQEPEEPQDGGELDVNSGDKDFENESYMFEYMDYAVQNMLEQEELIDYVHTDILREAVELPNGMGKDKNIIENLCLAYNAIVDKFQRLFQKQNSKKSEFIKKNANVIRECNMNGYKITSYSPEKLYGIKIVQLNYNDMSKYLVSEEAFLNQYYREIANVMKEDTQNGGKMSIKDAVSRLVITDPNNTIVLTPNTAGVFIDFASSYGDRMNEVLKDQLAIKNSQALAGRLIKNAVNAQQQATNNQTNNTTQQTTTNNQNNNTAQQQTPNNQQGVNASTYMTAGDYLNEVVVKPNVNNQNNSNQKDDIKKQINLFFRISTKISSARMTMYNTVFKDAFVALNSILQSNGKQSYKTQNDQQ